MEDLENPDTLYPQSECTGGAELQQLAMHYGLPVSVATASWPQAMLFSFLFISSRHIFCLASLCIFCTLALYLGFRHFAQNAPRTHFSCSNARKWSHGTTTPRISSALVLGYTRHGMPKMTYSKDAIALRRIRSMRMHVACTFRVARHPQPNSCTSSLQLLSTRQHHSSN